MKRIQAILMLIVVLSLMGCQTQETVEEPAVAMASVGEVVETAVTPTITTTTTITDTPTAITPTPETIDECLACHVDKDLLIETAAPIEEVVVESDGEG